MTRLGEKVRELRHARRLTRAALATRSGCPVSIIVRLELGIRRYVSAIDIQRLAMGLEIPEEELWATVPGGRSGRPWIHLVDGHESHVYDGVGTPLGQKVRELRVANQMTQLQVVVQSGVPRSFVTALEAGRCKYVRPEQIGMLAEALGVPEDDLWATIPGGKSESRYIPVRGQTRE